MTDVQTHAHAPANIGRAFAIGVALNLGFVIAEFLYGRLAHSLALVADAGHNLSDVLSLLLAWGAMLLSRRLPTQRRTYGFRRSSILASLINAVVMSVPFRHQAAALSSGLKQMPRNVGLQEKKP